MANHGRDSKRERFWRGVLERHRAGGLTVRTFCQQERLTESAFYFWRRTILERDVEVKSQTGLGTASPPRPIFDLRRGGHSKPASRAAPAAQPTFLPVLVDGNGRQDGGVAIELAGGRVLRLSEAIGPQRLAEIVSALEQTER